MRTDPDKEKGFFESSEWDDFDIDIRFFEPAGDQGSPPSSNPFSGFERNRLFLQTENNFDDVSLVSGADFREDGRGFALLDFDHDGFLDIVITSPNEPRLRIMRNMIGANQTQSVSGDIQSSIQHNSPVFVRLTGGAAKSDPQSEWSSRDAVGATFVVTTGKTKRQFQYSVGEGLSTQNSAWIHIGMGEFKTIDQIEIQWPSGKQTVVEDVAAGSRIEIFENENDDPSGR